MDNFDLTAFETGVEPVPVVTEVMGEKVSSMEGATIINKLIVGNPAEYPTTMGTSYLFPQTIGTAGQVLEADPTSNELDWVTPIGGGGDILNGGQTGPITIGTNNATDLSLISGANINIGDATTDDIHLNGGVRYHYTAVPYTGSAIISLTIADYFVEITGSGITTVRLPDATGISGHMYIISKGYAGGTLTIEPALASGDTIDGLSSLPLTSQDQRLKVISSGLDRWLIL